MRIPCPELIGKNHTQIKSESNSHSMSKIIAADAFVVFSLWFPLCTSKCREFFPSHCPSFGPYCGSPSASCSSFSLSLSLIWGTLSNLRHISIAEIGDAQENGITQFKMQYGRKVRRVIIVCTLFYYLIRPLIVLTVTACSIFVTLYPFHIAFVGCFVFCVCLIALMVSNGWMPA